MSKQLVQETFMAYLPSVSKGRALNKNGAIIQIGDIDGDSLPDAVVDYSLEPTLEETGGGGNAIGEIYGVVVFKNMGDGIQVIYQTEDIGNGQLLKIEHGSVIFKILEYAEDDPRCCPSIEYESYFFWDKETKTLQEEAMGC